MGKFTLNRQVPSLLLSFWSFSRFSSLSSISRTHPPKRATWIEMKIHLSSYFPLCFHIMEIGPRIFFYIISKHCPYLFDPPAQFLALEDKIFASCQKIFSWKAVGKILYWLTRVFFFIPSSPRPHFIPSIFPRYCFIMCFNLSAEWFSDKIFLPQPRGLPSFLPLKE